MKTGIVILAAGASARLGQPKQLLRFEGETLLGKTARVALESGCHPVVVVLGAHAETCHAEISKLSLHIVRNQNWPDGMASSIRAGVEALRALDDQLEAIILLVCDQPHISAAVIRELLAARRGDKTIVASQYADKLGVPALFAAGYFAELENLGGDAGARLLFSKHAQATAAVSFPEGTIDIDVMADLAALDKPNLLH